MHEMGTKRFDISSETEAEDSEAFKYHYVCFEQIRAVLNMMDQNFN